MKDSARHAPTGARPRFSTNRHWLISASATAILTFAAIHHCLAEDAPPAPTEHTSADLPTHDDGTIDYYQIVVDKYSEGVTLENNGAVLLARAIGPRMYDDDVREEALAKLGLTEESLAEDAPYFQNYRDYYEATVPGVTRDDAYEALETLTMLIRQPWSADDYPTIAAWLATIEKPLALAVQASERPRFYMPMVAIDDPPTLYTALLYDVPLVRHLTWALAARATLKLDSGDIDGAWQDTLTAHRLARQVAQSPTLYEWHIGVGMERAACGADEAIITSGLLTADQLRSMLADMSEMQPMPSTAAAMTTERFITLDCVSILERRDAKGIELMAVFGGIEPAPLAAILNAADFDTVRAKVRYWYRGIDVVASQDTYAEYIEARDEISEYYLAFTSDFHSQASNGPPSREGATKAVVAGLMIDLPQLLKAGRAHETVTSRSELNALALTMELYLLGSHNSKYPAAMADLVPDYLPAVPVDGFTGQALQYVRTDDGCKIYSLGPNMIDDGGLNFDDFEAAHSNVDGDLLPDAVLPEGMTMDADDIVIELQWAEE